MHSHSIFDAATIVGQANLPGSQFKARALPIHVNITHTPPVLADDESVSVASTDPGFIGTTSLVPSTFATGSYGWKGNKRFTVELDNPDGGEKEKVHVILTCVRSPPCSCRCDWRILTTMDAPPCASDCSRLNATVIGSKDAKEGEAEGEAEENAEGEHPEGETKEGAAEAADAPKDANGDGKEAPMEDVKEAE